MINLYPSAEPHPFVRDIDFYAGIGCGRICRAWDVFVTLSSWAVVDRAIARLAIIGRLGEFAYQHRSAHRATAEHRCSSGPDPRRSSRLPSRRRNSRAFVAGESPESMTTRCLWLSCFVSSVVAASVSPAAGGEPDESCRGPEEVGWVSATIVSFDARTRQCTISAPQKSPDETTLACINADAASCSPPYHLLLDGVAVGSGGISCFEPGTYRVTLCGTQCQQATFDAGTRSDVYVANILPRIVVRVETVWKGPQSLRGQVLEGPVRTYDGDNLEPGASIELRWPAGEHREFVTVESRCSYAQGHADEPNGLFEDATSESVPDTSHARPSPPGCSRCGGGSGPPSPFALVSMTAAALCWRRRRRRREIAWCGLRGVSTFISFLHSTSRGR